jgi:hypothetical protein
MSNHRMERITTWLEKRKVFCAAAATVFFGLNAGLHWEASKFLYLLMDRFGKTEVSVFFKIINVLLIVSTIGYFYRISRQKSIFRRQVLHLGITLGLIIASIFLLVTKSLEGIHFLQYAVLAFLLFPLIKNYWETIYWATILGIADEALQYWGLIRHWNYYDFNDVVLNLLGAALGVSILMLHDFSVRKLIFKRSKAVLSAAGVLVSGFFLFATGILGFYPSDDGTMAFISLRRIAMEQKFWITYTSAEAGGHHILAPVEGIVLVILLLIFYLWLDLKMAPKKT